MSSTLLLFFHFFFYICSHLNYHTLMNRSIDICNSLHYKTVLYTTTGQTSLWKATFNTIRALLGKQLSGWFGCLIILRIYCTWMKLFSSFILLECFALEWNYSPQYGEYGDLRLECIKALVSRWIVDLALHLPRIPGTTIRKELQDWNIVIYTELFSRENIRTTIVSTS